jgi:hypothetical protein
MCLSPAFAYPFSPRASGARHLGGGRGTGQARQTTRLRTRLGKIYVSPEHPLAELDQFWGLLGEALIVPARHGEAGNLMVERLHRIPNTAWQAQARAEPDDPGRIESVMPFPPPRGQYRQKRFGNL